MPLYLPIEGYPARSCINPLAEASPALDTSAATPPTVYLSAPLTCEYARISSAVSARDNKAN